MDGWLLSIAKLRRPRVEFLLFVLGVLDLEALLACLLEDSNDGGGEVTCGVTSGESEKQHKIWFLHATTNLTVSVWNFFSLYFILKIYPQIVAF